MDRLVTVWFENYYRYVLSVTDEDKLREILSGGVSNEAFVTTGGSCVKARRIECDPKDYAAGFWEKHDSEKYKACFTNENNADWVTLKCRLKSIMDSVYLASLRSNGLKRIDDEGDEYDYNMLDSPMSVVNSERLRSKRLFHAIVVDTFGNHREYPHTIMCREFVVKDKRWCAIWLKIIRLFSDYRLCRLKQQCADEEEEDARTGVRQAMKDWNAWFPPLSVSTKLREKDFMKIARKKRKNDSIARKLGRLTGDIDDYRKRYAEEENKY